MRLFIEPTEPLLFRTGRPFDAGESNYAETLFPPTPETLQGAVRAAIATHYYPAKTLAEAFQKEELVKLIGVGTHYGRFRIKGIALGRHKKDDDLHRGVECLFPIPAHIIQEEEGRKKQTRLRPKKRESDILTNLPDDMQLLYPDEPLKDKPEPMKGWLTEQVLQRVLQRGENIKNNEVIVNSDIFTYEPRLGIGIDNRTKATVEGRLYQIQMVRMNHQIDHPFVYGFVVDIRLAQNREETTASSEELIDDNQTQDQLKLPNYGWITLGGERRAARFNVIKPSEPKQQDDAEQRRKDNLLYLATPAALARGWQPKEWIAPLTKPIAAAINRYQPIGGWLLTPGSSGGENKTMRRCVPAGSVYFFDKSVTVIQPLTDYGREIGYGITYAGEW